MRVKPAPEPDGPAPDALALRVSGLDVVLGGTQILHGLNLAVRRGEVLAVLGANGSGKSTLIKSIVGTVPAAAGTIEILGRAAARAPWNRVGYVPQRVGATSGIAASAREIVASGLLGPGTLRKPRNWSELTGAALERVGLGDRADTAIHELSGGQQQRVLIARALIRQPDLLILDEPVAGVDQPSQRAFAQVLTELTQQGVTVVIVLHELGDFQRLITRTIVLDHGQIIHDGGPVRPAPGHEAPGHDHVHPHCDPEDPGLPSLLPEPVLEPAPTREGPGLKPTTATKGSN